MLLDKINKKNINTILYNKQDVDREWKTLETEDKRKVLYSVREDGVVISTNKKTYIEKILKPVLSNGVLVVRINRKVYKIKNLVAKCFIKEYTKNMCVLLKDNNPYNCNINNLILKDKKSVGKITGGKANSISVIQNINGKKIKYNSIKEFCKNNYIGVRTYFDKKSKRYNTSIVDDLKFKELNCKNN